MVIPDVNLLIYAHDELSPYHASAYSWWDSLMRERTEIGLPWVTALGFVRLVTSPKVLRVPVAIEEATVIVAEWLQMPNVVPLNPGEWHWRQFSDLLRKSNGGAKLVTDAHIASLAIEYRAELHTNDRDFQRLSGFRIVNPLT